jgi:glycosyltransferase involved in cell wall biosynthesis
MRIGLFALETGRNVGGLEVYERNLIRGLSKIDRQNEYLIFCLDPKVPALLELEAPNFEFRVLKMNRLKGVAWDAPRAMARANLDLFHAIFVPPPWTSVPYVFTHHGSEVMERPDFYPFALGLRMRVLFRCAFRKASLILCVSDYVRNYLAEERGIDEERLATVYYGSGPEFRPIAQVTAHDVVARKYALRDRFLLTVGRIEPRKNPIRVLRAYDQFRRRVADPPKLAFAGMKTWSGREFDRTVNELGLRDHVVELGHVPHEDLPALYSASEFAIFASLWEGFGLPIMEAFATGTPVITSNGTCMPEVSGGAALLVDPHSCEEIAGAMCSLHSDKQLRMQLIDKGLARASAFSWERTACETLNAYETVAARSKRRLR